MQQIAALMPHEDIIYFGDTARIPYGNKTPQAILRYSIENVIFLMEHKIKVLVVACNTASAYAIEKLKQIFKVPIIGVIEAGVERVSALTQNQRIAIMGTRGTIHSGAYQREIQKCLPKASLFPIPCPLLVPLVEEEWLSHEATRLILNEYLKPLAKENVDTILLGCTHYPLLRSLIQEVAGGHVQIVDSASSCAEKVKALLDICGLRTSLQDVPKHFFYVSEDAEKFRKLGEAFLGRQIETVGLKSF